MRHAPRTPPAHNLHRTTIVVLCSFALVACTTLRTVSSDAASSASAATGPSQIIKTDDNLVVSLKDGTRIEMRVTNLNSTTIIGVSKDQPTNVSVSIAQIEKIERFEVDSKRILLGVGLAILAAVIASKSFAKDAGERLTPRP